MERQATESIPAKRKAAFDQVQEIAARESPMLFLVYRNTLCAVSSELQNVLPSVVGPSLIWNIERLYFAPARHIEAKR
jgi:ABC-type transport system substrate-binding protein